MAEPRDPHSRPERLRRTICRAAGVLLLAIPFLPLRARFGTLPGTKALVPPTEWLLGIGIFATLAWVAAIAFAASARRDLPARWIERLLVPRGARTAAAALVLLAILLLVTSHFVFDHRPRLVDEVVQLFQAKIFAAGAVVAPPPPGGGFFAVQHMIVEPGGWYAQYPPGHALALAIGVLAGAPWVVPILLTLGTFALLHAFVREAYGSPAARVTAALALLCPFFWIMGASFMSHVSELFFVVLFLFAFARWEAGARTAWLVAAATALGAGFLSRPLTFFAIGAVFALPALGTVRRRRAWQGAALAVLAFLVLASAYPLYNHLTTGHAFTTGYVRLWGEEHGLGFHATPWGDVHTPGTGLRNELIDLALLNAFLFEWPLPSLLPVGLFLAAGLASRGWDRRLLAGLLAIPAVYFFYWHRDDFLGPRFLYPAIAFALPLTARALLAGWQRLRAVEVQPLGLFRPFGAGAFAASLAALSIAFGAVVGAPMRFGIHASSWPSTRVDVIDQARAAGIDGGIIFVATSWGSRLMARMYGLGVGPALTEQAYHEIDHCRLDELVDRAELEAWPTARLEREIRSRMAGEELIPLKGLTGDPTLRLEPNSRLSRGCLAEIAYDRQGFGLYTPHLSDNAPGLDDRWIVARDMRSRNPDLLEAYPDRRAWLYRKGEFQAVPVPASLTTSR